LGFDRKRRTVGRQRNVDLAAVGGPERCKHAHQLWQRLSKQRLATGEADLLDPMVDSDPGEPGYLLKGQQLLTLHEHEVLAEDLFRHAVDTAEVAPIRHRNA
jgi:hypothetical protein